MIRTPAILAPVSLTALALLAVAAASLRNASLPPPATPPGPRYTVPPAPVLPVQQALAAIRTVPGLAVSLAASEPLVVSPVAATFDEDGRLWVVQMPAFMRDPAGTDELAPTGCVCILEDRNHDGVFETSTVFLDRLVLPRSVAPCYGGALVIEPPALYFCPDENRDGKADRKIELLRGFGGLDNPEHAGNALTYGLDNWYHLSQHHVEFRFDGARIVTRRTPAHGQWGLTQDDAGRLYYTPNSDPLLTDLYPKHYAARNPALAAPAGMGEPIGKGAEPTWPSRPTPGVNRGYMDRILRPDGTLAALTAACGPAFYSATSLGPDYRGDVFIADAAGLLVKRLVLSDQGGHPRAANAYRGSELLTSTDERFRPVQCLVGPDGALCVIDFARGLIQHKNFLTPYLKDQARSRNLEQPLDLGRIWRITAAAGVAPAIVPRLSTAADQELIQLLAHPDGWWRLTAQRLLVQRRATAAQSSLRELARSTGPELPRLHALWTLEGLNLLREQDAAAAMSDASPTLRAAGLRLAEPYLSSSLIRARAVELADDPDRTIRLQAAATLGQSREPAGTAALERILHRHPSDPALRSAVVSGLAGRESAMLSHLLADSTWPESEDAWSVLALLCDTSLRDTPGERADLVELAADLSQRDDPRAWLLVARIREAQRLSAVTPKPLELAREPRLWLAAAADRACRLSPSLAESALYFDWPGRPPVRRPRNLRPLTRVEEARFKKGESLYVTCVACHASDGRGSPGLGPPLAASSRVEGPESKLARILLHGLEGEYEVGGTRFQGVMPAPPLADDDEIAAVMTYIRRAWGNTGDPVTAEAVSRIRNLTKDHHRPWTRQELDPPGGL